MINIKSKKRGRRRKMNFKQERLVYEQKINGRAITEIAYKNGISTRTVERIIKRIKELQN